MFYKINNVYFLLKVTKLYEAIVIGLKCLLAMFTMGAEYSRVICYAYYRVTYRMA